MMIASKPLKTIILYVLLGYCMLTFHLDIGWIPLLQDGLALGLLFIALRYLKNENNELKMAYVFLWVEMILSAIMYTFVYLVPLSLPYIVNILLVLVKPLVFMFFLKGIKTYCPSLHLSMSIFALSIAMIISLLFVGQSSIFLLLVFFVALSVVMVNIYLCYKDAKQDNIEIVIPQYKVHQYIALSSFFGLSLVVGIIVILAWPYFSYEYIEMNTFTDNFPKVATYDFKDTKVPSVVDVYDEGQTYLYRYTYQQQLDKKYSYLDMKLVSDRTDIKATYVYVYDKDQRFVSYKNVFDESIGEVARTYLNPSCDELKIIVDVIVPKEIDMSNNILLDAKLTPQFFYKEYGLFPNDDFYMDETTISGTEVSKIN